MQYREKDSIEPVRATYVEWAKGQLAGSQLPADRALHVLEQRLTTLARIQPGHAVALRKDMDDLLSTYVPRARPVASSPFDIGELTSRMSFGSPLPDDDYLEPLSTDDYSPL